MSSTSRTMTQPVRVPQVVSSTIVPGQVAAAGRAPSWSAGPRRKPPASRSSIAPKTRGQSIRGRHIHSTLPLGATSARRLAVGQERVVGDRRERAAAERHVADDLPHAQRLPRRRRARAGRSGRAAAPGGCPRRGCPASPREAPRTVHSRSRAVGARVRRRAQPARRRGRATATCPPAVSSVDAREAAAPSCVAVGLEPDLDVLAPRAGVPCSAVARRRQRARASSPAATAASRRAAAPRRRSPGGGGSSPREIVAELGRAGAAGRTSPRCARATASSAARRGRRRRPARRAAQRAAQRVARRRARRRSRSSTTWASAQQRVDGLGVAVRRPHDRRQVGDDERVDDRVEVLEVLAGRRRRRRARAASRTRRARVVPVGGDRRRSRRASCGRGSTAQTIVRDAW